MSKAVFITGTGTDMGKTYLSGLIVKKLAQAGKNPAYYKAAMSGNDRRTDGSLIPGDALFVKEMSGISQSLDDIQYSEDQKYTSMILLNAIESALKKAENS